MEFSSWEAICPAKRELILWLPLSCLCYNFLGVPSSWDWLGQVGTRKADEEREGRGGREGGRGIYYLG